MISNKVFGGHFVNYESMFCISTYYIHMRRNSAEFIMLYFSSVNTKSAQSAE